MDNESIIEDLIVILDKPMSYEDFIKEVSVGTELNEETVTKVIEVLHNMSKALTASELNEIREPYKPKGKEIAGKITKKRKTLKS